MFEGFARVWTPVVLAKRLKKAAPLRVELAGEKLVLFRGEDGAPHALLDRCPHRGASLALGTVKHGCVECPFHGWRFGGDGENRHVPLNPDAKRERLFAVSLPARQIAGLIYVYTAPVKAAEAPELVLPEGLTDPGYTRTFVERTWRCHWSRAMENMLDSPHLPFVHRTTIGRPMRAVMKEDTRMVVSWEDQPWGGRQRTTLEGDRRDLAHLDFYRPNMMALHIPIPGKRFRIHALVVPVNETTTRLIVVGARDWLRLPLLNPFFNLSNAFIADQDRAVVESSDPPKVPPPAQELSVPTDRATLQFRKYYFEALEGSSVEPPRRTPSSVAHHAA